jgi:L-ascorbate metabolism protein UlaG (beta-lactamase superfamily)
MESLRHETDVFLTSRGELRITFLGHGSLMMGWNDQVIHVDPFGKVTDYSALPKADLILITHEHFDHLDEQAVSQVRTEETEIVMTELCQSSIDDGIVMRNGDVAVVKGIPIEAVPAYNLIHRRESGDPFHPCGQGNGYVLSLGDHRVYIAGDSENTPEMMNLREIDIAFLPMNLPYTMSPEMVADAARAIRPRVLYPYHFGETDTSRLTELLCDLPDVEVRIRHMA